MEVGTCWIKEAKRPSYEGFVEEAGEVLVGMVLSKLRVSFLAPRRGLHGHGRGARLRCILCALELHGD